MPRRTSSRPSRALVLGAGLAGLAAAERLLDAGLRVTVIDAFPVPGGRVASFDVRSAVAGLIPGDVVEHGLHAWFQHYHALHALMARAGVERPALVDRGVYFFSKVHGHYAVEGGPGQWLIEALRLPPALRGKRRTALAAFGRLIAELARCLDEPERTDASSAWQLLHRAGVPAQALESVFRPCLYSLTSLPLEELSALEMMRWMSSILPDPRMRAVRGGGTSAMCAPIADHLRARGADIRLGIEVERLSLDAGGRARVALAQAPDRTGLRHVLVPGFKPAAVPDTDGVDLVISALPWERLRAVADASFGRYAPDAAAGMAQLANVHPLAVRLWFERPIEGARERYVLSSGTLFDVLRPTAEPERYPGIRMIDLLVEDIDRHLPELGYDRERYLPQGSAADAVLRRMLADLELVYPGRIANNRVLRSFVHTREGIVACRPGTWTRRAPAFIGSPYFALAGDWTRQPYGVCMEGAVRSGQLAAETLLQGHAIVARRRPFSQVAYSLYSIAQRS